MLGIEPIDVMLHVAVSPLRTVDVERLLSPPLPSGEEVRALAASRRRAAMTPSVWLGERAETWTGEAPPPPLLLMMRELREVQLVDRDLVSAMAQAADAANGTPWATVRRDILEGFLREHLGEAAFLLGWSRKKRHEAKPPREREPRRPMTFWGAEPAERGYGLFRFPDRASALAWVTAGAARLAWRAPQKSPPLKALAYRALALQVDRTTAMVRWLDTHGHRI